MNKIRLESRFLPLRAARFWHSLLVEANYGRKPLVKIKFKIKGVTKMIACGLNTES